MEVENGMLYRTMDMTDHLSAPQRVGGTATFAVNHALAFVLPSRVGADARDGDPTNRLAVRAPASQSRTPKAGLEWPCLQHHSVNGFPPRGKWVGAPAPIWVGVAYV